MKTTRMLIALLLLAAPALSAHSADHIPTRFTDISERDYFPAVHKEITKGEEALKLPRP